MARAIESAGIAIFINSRRFFLVASSELLSASSVATAPGEIIVHRIFWECNSIRSPSVKARPAALVAIDRSTRSKHFDPKNGSDVDDVTALLLLHLRQGGSNSIEKPFDID